MVSKDSQRGRPDRQRTIFIEKLDEHLETPTADEHLQRLHRRVAQRRDEDGCLESALGRVLLRRTAEDKTRIIQAGKRGQSLESEPGRSRKRRDAQGDDDRDPPNEAERLETADVLDVDLNSQKGKEKKTSG